MRCIYIFYAIYSQVMVFCFPRAVRAEPLLGFEMNNKYFVSNNFAGPIPAGKQLFTTRISRVERCLLLGTIGSINRWMFMQE